jgi:phosphate-selective porin
MMKFSSRAAMAAVASLMLIGTASAQAPATTPAPATKSAPADTKAPATAKTAKPRTEISLECSKQADAKGLHGKERHKFRSDCKKTGGKAT